MSSEKIVVALDTPILSDARDLVRVLKGSVGAFKVGLEFLHSCGPEGVRTLINDGAGRIFVDGKFSDIPNTVAGAVRSVCRLRPWMIDVHAMADTGAMTAARLATNEVANRLQFERPLVIAVTVLTSIDDAGLKRIGVDFAARDEVIRLTKLAYECGLDGVVASPHEIESIRQACGPNFLIVTPGVRPAGAEVNDQKRVMTPGAAVRCGADYLVIGRPITEAADPADAVKRIVDEIAIALSARDRMERSDES